MNVSFLKPSFNGSNLARATSPPVPTCGTSGLHQAGFGVFGTQRSRDSRDQVDFSGGQLFLQVSLRAGEVFLL